MDLATKLYGSPEVKASPRFSIPKRVPNGFTIEHYAGAVTYHTDHFLDKNRDFVVAEHQGLMQGSSSGFVRALFPPDEDSAATAPVRPPMHRWCRAAERCNRLTQVGWKALGELQCGIVCCSAV